MEQPKTAKKPRKEAAPKTATTDAKALKKKMVESLTEKILEVVKQEAFATQLASGDLKLKKLARKAAKEVAKTLDKAKPKPAPKKAAAPKKEAKKESKKEKTKASAKAKPKPAADKPAKAGKAAA